jgi:hypothetical protein
MRTITFEDGSTYGNKELVQTLAFGIVLSFVTVGAVALWSEWRDRRWNKKFNKGYDQK